MAKKTPDNVESFLAALDHPHLATIRAVRRSILAAAPGITEGIKWNAPSFRTTEWFATFHLRAKAGVQVILHRGAKVRDGAVDLDDPTGLLVWLGMDRASVTFADEADAAVKAEAFGALIRKWVEHV